MFAVRVCVSVRVYLTMCACICARVYVCTCVLEVYTQSAHCWCVSVGSVHSFVCIDVYFFNIYMCVLCEWLCSLFAVCVCWFSMSHELVWWCVHNWLCLVMCV